MSEARIERIKAAYVGGEIEADEMEKQIERALNPPPLHISSVTAGLMTLNEYRYKQSNFSNGVRP